MFRFGLLLLRIVAESRNTSHYYFLFHKYWSHRKTEKYGNRTTKFNTQKQQQILEYFHDITAIHTLVQN